MKTPIACVALLFLCALAGCGDGKSRATNRNWSSVTPPGTAYKERWIYIDEDSGGIVGEVWQENDKTIWSAWTGEHPCQPGDFISLATAKKCIEKDLR